MGASLVTQLVKNPSCFGKISWRRDRLPTPVFMGFPGGSDDKESACNGGDLDLIPGLGRSSGGGRGNPLQYSCLENPYGQRSLAGYSPWVRKESYTTEQLSTAQHQYVIQKKKHINDHCCFYNGYLCYYQLNLICTCYVQSFTPLINHVRQLLLLDKFHI